MTHRVSYVCPVCRTSIRRANEQPCSDRYPCCPTCHRPMLMFGSGSEQVPKKRDQKGWENVMKHALNSYFWSISPPGWAEKVDKDSSSE